MDVVDNMVASVPEDWEDLEEDGPGLMANDVSRDGGICSDQMVGEADATSAVPIGSSANGAVQGSGHSRFKKDLVNLEKATAKWLKQESEGRINLGDLVGRIRSSPAAQHLRSVHGDDFRQEEFVEEVIARATRALAPRALDLDNHDDNSRK